MVHNFLNSLFAIRNFKNAFVGTNPMKGTYYKRTVSWEFIQSRLRLRQKYSSMQGEYTY